MAVRIVRLGSDRTENEGLRIGTVRRPPRGVAKSQHASGNWYDVWYPQLAPSAELVKQALQATTDAQWRQFERRYRTEMKAKDPAQTIELLARLSHHAEFSVGCYCQDAARCHRSILGALLAEHGAHIEAV